MPHDSYFGTNYSNMCKLDLKRLYTLSIPHFNYANKNRVVNTMELL